LYYLNSRYYNPEIGRFINADGLVGQTGEILSHNMYAYTSNNPVMRVDENGYFWHIIGGAIVGGLLNTTSKLVGNIISGEDPTKGLVGAFVGGAVAGAVAAATFNIQAAAIAGGVSEAFIDEGENIIRDGRLDDGIQWSDIDYQSLATDAVVNTGLNLLGGKASETVVPGKNFVKGSLTKNMATPKSLTAFFTGNWGKKFIKSYIPAQTTVFIGSELVINPIRNNLG